MVYHRSGKHHRGKVLECDGDTIYIVRTNGVELDFQSGELTATPPQEKSPAVVAAAALSRTLTIDDITPDHQRVLGIIPQRTIQSVALLFERQPNSGRFSALKVAQKLNFIAMSRQCPTGRCESSAIARVLWD